MPTHRTSVPDESGTWALVLLEYQQKLFACVPGEAVSGDPDIAGGGSEFERCARYRCLLGLSLLRLHLVQASGCCCESDTYSFARPLRVDGGPVLAMIEREKERAGGIEHQCAAGGIELRSNGQFAG